MSDRHVISCMLKPYNQKLWGKSKMKTRSILGNYLEKLYFIENILCRTVVYPLNDTRLKPYVHVYKTHNESEM